MALDCRIIRDDNGNLKKVEAPNGEKSILFDKLKNFFGEKKALELYALTETEAFKNLMSYKRGVFLNQQKEKLNDIRFSVGEEKTAGEINQELIDRLKQNGLSEDVFLMSTEEIDAKLKELGVSDDVRKQVSDYVKGYYSNANIAFSNLKDKNVKNVQGWMKALTDVQKNGGIKNVNQELEWIGLEDYLNEYVKENNPKAGNIPYSVVEDYIKSNQIEIVDVSKGYNRNNPLILPKVIEEVVPQEDYIEAIYKEEKDGTIITFKDKQKDRPILGFSVVVASTGEAITIINNRVGNAFSKQDGIDSVLQAIPEKKQYIIYDENGKKLDGVYDSEWMAKDTYYYNDALRNYEGSKNNTKYSGYQLKGGENYREVLLTMPSKEGKNPLHTKRDQLSKQYREAFDSGNYDLANEIDNQISDITKQLKAENSLNTTGEKAQYKSSHWDEANILAHVRMNEKTLPDGRKVLIINEIQSDWAQEGRKKGFKKNTESVEKIEEDYNKWLKSNNIPYTDMDMLEAFVSLTEQQSREYSEFLSRYDYATEKASKVPNTPYANTDQWIGLVTRRVMQMASQEGYDGIAFATGQQSADMYSLAKQVDNISWDTSDNTLTAFDKNGKQQFQQSNVTDEKLENFVGKEVAEKLIKRKESLTEEDEGVVNLENADLEVGGEGMKTFYDKIVPKVVQKEAQRFDKNAKLETVDFGDGDLKVVNVSKDKDFPDFVWVNSYGEKISDGFSTEEQALKNKPKDVKDKLSLGVQPYLSLTQPIKDSVSQGIPQFQKALNKVGIDMIVNGFVYKNQVFLNKDVASNETAIHEFSHLFNSWLKENKKELYNKGIDLVKVELEKENSDISEIISYVKTTQPDLKGEALAEEILTELTGRRGAELLNSKKKSGIIDWIREAFKEIGKMLGLLEATPEEISKMTLKQFADASAVQLLKGNSISEIQVQKKTDEYLNRIERIKKQDPDNYWSVDIPSREIVENAVRNNRLVETEGGMAIVEEDGNMIGLFKDSPTAKNVAKTLQEMRIEKGGFKMDNFDGYLTKIYEKNGFRVVSRLAFNEAEDIVPPDWNKEKHGTPDVVFMIYDPKSELNIEEKSFDKDSYDEAKDYRNSFSEEAKAIHPYYKFENNSQKTQDFFSDVVSGKSEKYKAKKPWTPLLTLTKAEDFFNKIYSKFKGNFDNHIATSIPTFRETQVKVGNTLVNLIKKGVIYDIGGSEGGFVKAITEASNGQIETINLDPNPEMEKAHNISPVKGSTFVREAFYESFEDDGVVYKKHVPSKKADVVHESMVFQFITPERRQFIKEIKDNYLKEDGIVLLEEKLVPNTTEEWVFNEERKDEYKRQYYSQEVITEKAEQVLTGMFKNQTKESDLLNILNKDFSYVGEYWDAGNFKGYIATNSKTKFDQFFTELGGKIVSEYSSKINIQYQKAPQQPIVQVGGAKVFAKKQVNPINDKPTGRIELDLITSENRGSGEAKEAMKQFLQIMDANKQEVFLTVSPRDKETSFDRLVKFYESFGFRLEPSGIEMVRRPKKVIPPTEDKNGEAKADEVIKFSKTTDEKLSKEELIEAMDAAVSLGVETSEELLENLDFNEYEQMKVDMGKVERLKAKLKNTPFSVPLVEVEKTSKVNSFGKQVPQVKQPTLPVQTVDENGNIVDKLSDTKEVLQLTYPENKKDNLMPKLVGAIQKINNEIFNENTKLVYDVIQDIKEEALDFGVDLKDIENRVFPFQKLKDFLSALQEYTINPTAEFAKVYDEFFNVEPLRAYKPTFSSEYSEYELYDKFNLIRVGDIYQKVETPKLEPSAERQAKIAQLQVDDFRTDVVKLEEMVYHKEQLGQPLKTLPFEEVEAVNLREVKKNPYLKVTAKGVDLINQDPLTLEKAMVYGYEPQVKETVEKIETDYSVIEDVLVTDLNNKSKVRTPLGVYTKIMDFQNKSIYTANLKNKTVNIKALLEKSDISPKIEAKKYYTKEEYDKNFSCL